MDNEQNNLLGQLIQAITENNIPEVDRLLDMIPDINVTYETPTRHVKPLHHACNYNREDIVVKLLKKGADINIKNYIGQTPLMIASVKGYENLVDLLLKGGAYKNSKNFRGRTALDLTEEAIGNAILYNRVQGVPNDEVVLGNELGNDNNTDKIRGYKRIIEMLKKEDSIAALAAASKTNNVVLVKNLLENGVNVNHRIHARKNGITPLMWASMKGYANIVQLLLANGANGNIKDDDEDTALILASENGKSEVVEMLLENSVDIDMQNNDGCTALIYACENMHIEVVDMLLAYGANINIKDRLGCTALMHMVLLYDFKRHYNKNIHFEKIIARLIEGGIGLNIGDKLGNTPLMIACKKGIFWMVEYLITNNADISIKNKDGKTALMIASMNGHEAIVKLLKNKYHVTEGGRKDKTKRVLKIKKRTQKLKKRPKN
jgi:serine/threonine-protein phosphatase 6 regulatory ankyrin repeat subunit B